MSQYGFPDVLGWELPKALDELRALGFPVSVIRTAAPNKKRVPEANVEEDGQEALAYRVVAIRSGCDGGCLLITCAEVW